MCSLLQDKLDNSPLAVLLKDTLSTLIEVDLQYCLSSHQSPTPPKPIISLFLQSEALFGSRSDVLTHLRAVLFAEMLTRL